MGESELVERVFLRIVSTETDDAFQASLHKFLAPLLLKLASQDESVRKKVMELLVHINKRLKSRPQVALPMGHLITQYNDPANPSMVTNFSMIYIKMGFPRMPNTDQWTLVPEILKIIQNKPAVQQEQFIMLILPAFRDIIYPGDIDKKKAEFGLTDEPALRALLLRLMMDILLMPYSAHFPAPDAPASSPSCPPCYSETSWKRVCAMHTEYPSAATIEGLKVGVTKYLCDDVLPPNEISLHLIIASADSRHTVATMGESELRRLNSDTDWNRTDIMTKLTTMYLGSVNQVNKDPKAGTVKETATLPAPARIKAKLFPVLLRSTLAAKMFPQNIQIACDGLAGPDSKPKLKKFGIQFIARMAEYSLPHHLKAIGPTLITYLWKVIDEADDKNVDIKPLAYATIGKLVSKVSSLVFDKVDIVSTLFSRLEKELEKTVRSSIQEALTMMTPSVPKCRQDVKDLIETLLTANVESSTDDAVRRISVYMAHHAFHTSWIPTRYLLLLACSDDSHEVQTLASQLLYSPRQIEMPIPEHSFDLDLYPRFTEMMSYVQKKQEQRVADKKTVTRGSLVMAFRHDSIKAMVSYLRACLARSAGDKDPHCTDLTDCRTQAPTIAKYITSLQHTDGQEQPAKQQKLSAENSAPSERSSAVDVMNESLIAYCGLLTQNIQLQASPTSCYLLLELLSISPELSLQMQDKINWVKGLVMTSHDSVVQSSLSQLLAVLVVEGKTVNTQELIEDCLKNFKPTLTVEQQHGSLNTMGSLIAYSNLRSHNTQQDTEPSEKWRNLCSQVVKLIEPLTHDIPKAQISLQVLQQISLSGSLCIDIGSEESMDGEINVYSIIKSMCEKVKSSKLEAKQRERVATCLGYMGVGDKSFPFRKMCMDGLFECSSTKELELHFTVGQALVMCAQGLYCSERRDSWRQTENDYWSVCGQTNSDYHDIGYLINSILDKYICHVNPHIKQAACVWLLTAIKKSSHFEEVKSRSSKIQSAFMRLLSENDEVTQDIASKGLGLVYDSCDEVQRKDLISNLVGTLMTGKSAEKKSGEVSAGETKLFSEGTLGATPDGKGMSTYRELCAIATDLNQPDLIYKFLHLANHQSMWNSRKGAAFGFSTIAAQAGEQLAPYMSQIVPRLYRYTFDPNIKIQTAMRGIWNAVVTETKPTVDKYVREIMEDLLSNLTNNQWRVRESCCLAVNDLIRGRQLDDVLDHLPELWHIMMKLLDDIKESTRTAATTAAKTLSKVTIKICDVSYGKSGEKALSLILPVLLKEGITSNVQEVRALSLDTVVQMSKNAGAFLKPHIHTLVPIMLESLSGLEPQQLNYLALRVSGQEDIQQRLERARVAALKMSPMMDSINLCIQQVDDTVLPELIPRLTDLIKSSIGLGTKVGIATVINSLCMQCGVQTMQPYAGKCMAALLNGLSDRNTTVRKSYSTCLANVCKVAKDSSVEKLITKLYTWYMEKDDESLQDTCGQTLRAMSEICPDTLNKHKTQVLPLVFLAMHKVEDKQPSAEKKADSVWKDIWNEVTIGTDSAVKLYIQEFITITDTALQSSSWLMKAQAASAMGTIAKSAGENMNTPHLSQLINALLNGLSGRTWDGKEALLTALSDVVMTCSATLKSQDCPVKCEDIIKAGLREARKESLSYKISAVTCLCSLLQSLEADNYNDLYEIVLPYVSINRHEDEDISVKMLINMREVGFEAIGKAWPTQKHQNSQYDHITSTTQLLFTRLPQVTWKEQLAVWRTLCIIVQRTKLTEVVVREGSTWSLPAFCDQLIKSAIISARESKYSSIREAACENVKQLLTDMKDEADIPSASSQNKLSEYITDTGADDSSLTVKKYCEEIMMLL